MLKQTRIAGLSACLALMTWGVCFAGVSPYGISDEGQLLPRIARAIEKQSPGDPSPLAGPVTEIQAGVARTGADFCVNMWQGPASYYWSAWYQGDEFYAVFQDPENEGSCVGLGNVYTFDVTAIKWYVYALQAGQSYDMQPLVYADAGEAICHFPGEVQCAGPIYAIDLSSTGGYIVDLPLPDQCCVYKEYFAGVYAGPYVGTGALAPVTDDGTTIPQAECRSYNDYDGSWHDLVGEEGWTSNLELWSVGTTYDQNSCPGTPADYCDQISYHGAPSVSWTDPDINLTTDRWARIVSECFPCEACTLYSAEIGLDGAQTQGTPTMRVRVYGSNGPNIGGTYYPAQNSNPPGTDPNLIGEIDVPFADLQFYPAVTTVDLQLIPGWPNGFVLAPTDWVFVSVSLSPNTPSPGLDVLSLMSDGGGGLPNYSGAYHGTASAYLTNLEAFGISYNWAITVNRCCVDGPYPPGPCDNPGPDEWTTWAHDYQRTCASNLEVGDPCQLNPVWTRPLLNNLSSFCEPTISDGRVYISGDTKLFQFDLSTGLPENTISGIPYIFGNNRGNMTIDGGYIYVTGGNGQSIAQWDAAMTAPNWVNGFGPGNVPLGGDCRFGITAVYDVAGTEVVVVGTEGSPGRLWCFETATGAAYADWSTNPVLLPEGIWHSPTYDGSDLYVGTAGSLNEGGKIYSIDAATGSLNWTYTPPDPGDGFPGGVSVEGEYVYAASSRPDGSGTRVKLDKSSGAPIWELAEARSLYGVPAIARNFLFINQDGAGGGVLVIDKNTGAALYNFAADGVGQVSQHVTLTCDDYLFAGDRSGKWWLLDISNLEVVSSVQFNGIVNGTALAVDPSGGEYAVVGIRSGNSVDGDGYVAAFEFNSGVRPRAVQNTTDADIHVIPGTGGGNPYTKADVLTNWGCADLNITSHNVYDPPPDYAAQAFRGTQARYAASLANLTIGDGYLAYWDESSKPARVANQMITLTDGELTRGDVAMEKAAKAMAGSSRESGRMAAASEMLRTSAVTYTSVISVGSSTDLNWMYDGTGLGRGLDVEEIELVTNDPDRLMFGGQPLVTIRYIGGCLPDVTSIVWNTMGAPNEEKFTNTGRLADGDYPSNLIWGNDPNGAMNNQLYDGTFFVAGPVPPDGDNAQFYMGDIYNKYPRQLLPDSRPSDHQCEFDAATDVHMGWKRTGGCPGVPQEILGAWVRSYFVDSNETLSGTPYAAIGLNITQTEVGAYDPLYGDFSLIKWDLTERNGETEDPVYAGTWTDFDAHPAANRNHGIISDVFNGYALWDWVTPTIAYGFLDPRMPTDNCGVNPVPYSPHRIQEMGQRPPPNIDEDDGGYSLWQNAGAVHRSYLWESVVNGAPRKSGPHLYDPVLWNDDHFGLLVSKGLSIGPHETKSIVQAKFAVPVDDVGSEAATDVDAVEERCAELARRAAIWSGYARGDVNMDGCVNLIDVCWLNSNVLTSAPQVYPDDYNGDVDLSGTLDPFDVIFLLTYVTGLGPAPPGEWRFDF